MAEQLSLNTLDHLVDPSFLASTPQHGFEISNLAPPCSRLLFSGFKTLFGQFPGTLNTLKINLNGYYKSFEQFWERFITPLNNLYRLKIQIAKTTHTIDFSHLHFPQHLHILELYGNDYLDFPGD
ncbi:unnamed protein product [Ambrosiozyma monospora]|uniref:Unnamed protein product n=1 Tax=Ambrosiozyma monospora TaxID=43982 RepID=A0ACB5U8Q3_AMBMO|nr:unnamed protein product [Ambrosiozyma monospora]